jgi:hypothetical protein
VCPHISPTFSFFVITMRYGPAVSRIIPNIPHIDLVTAGGISVSPETMATKYVEIPVLC